MHEFDIIAQHFKSLTHNRPETSGLLDDGALLKVPDGFQLVVSSDTLNAGTHFFLDSPPAMIAHKALRSNLSDLAAMGAVPYAYQLNIAFPDKPTSDWLSAFTNALLKDQKMYSIFCSGGDTTSIKGGHISISITAMGLVKDEGAWYRGDAQNQDILALSDTIGDSWIGLQVLNGTLETDDDAYFINRYYKPRVQFINHPDVTAAIDISDGMIADIAHICRTSKLGAKIRLEDVPFSPQAQKLLDQNQVTSKQLITGGDDYVLALALPKKAKHSFYEVGYFSKEIDGLRVLDKGNPIEINRKGWQHF